MGQEGRQLGQRQGQQEQGQGRRRKEGLREEGRLGASVVQVDSAPLRGPTGQPIHDGPSRREPLSEHLAAQHHVERRVFGILRAPGRGTLRGRGQPGSWHRGAAAPLRPRGRSRHSPHLQALGDRDLGRREEVHGGPGLPQHGERDGARTGSDGEGRQALPALLLHGAQAQRSISEVYLAEMAISARSPLWENTAEKSNLLFFYVFRCFHDFHTAAASCAQHRLLSFFVAR